ELTHEFEGLIALFNLLHREIPQTLEAECFHAKTGQHASVNHRSTQIVEVNLLDCAGEISGHSTSKRVPCPSRIVNVFKRVSATTEELISLAKEQCAVLTFFYRDVLRPHLSDPTPCFNEAGFLCYFARFAVVENEQINALKQRVEIPSGCLDPKIHRVSDYKTRALHLIEHMGLERWRDVSQQNKIGLTIRFRQYRLKIFEHVECDRARFPGVQVPRIFARPAESLSVRSLHAFAIDLVQPPKLKFRFRKVVAYDTDQPNRRKETCRERCVASRSA